MALTDSRFVSRLTLIVAWILPFPIFSFAVVVSHFMKPEIHDIQIIPALFTIGQGFIPMIGVILSHYFPSDDADETRQDRPMTPPHFWIAFSLIAFFDAVAIVVFFATVIFADYSSIEIKPESFEARLSDCMRYVIYFSLVPLTPINFIFSKLKK